MTKTFREDLMMFRDKIRDGVNFAFSRFSDGELYVMQNKEVMMWDKVIIDKNVYNNPVPKDDFKHFKPGVHDSLRLALIDCFTYKASEYWKGKPCRCCVGEENHKWIMDLLTDPDHDNLSWSNVFVNGNYPAFVELILPLFRKRDCIIVCNKEATVRNLPFPVEAHIPIGENAMINDLHVIPQLEEYLTNHGHKDKILLLAASSLSNQITRALFPKFSTTTFIDIGSTLNSFFGFPLSRGYLSSYWYGLPDIILHKMCIW